MAGANTCMLYAYEGFDYFLLFSPGIRFFNLNNNVRLQEGGQVAGEDVLLTYADVC